MRDLNLPPFLKLLASLKNAELDYQSRKRDEARFRWSAKLPRSARNKRSRDASPFGADFLASRRGRATLFRGRGWSSGGRWRRSISRRDGTLLSAEIGRHRRGRHAASTGQPAKRFDLRARRFLAARSPASVIRIGGSCDLTPLDFFLRGCSKSKVYVERSRNAHHERFSHDREKFRGGHLPYPTYFVIRLKDNTLLYLLIFNSLIVQESTDNFKIPNPINTHIKPECNNKPPLGGVIGLVISILILYITILYNWIFINNFILLTELREHVNGVPKLTQDSSYKYKRVLSFKRMTKYVE